MAATMEDVARLAGVSTATVSRALNAPELVSHATRERVLQAMQSLDYKINLAARSLRTNQTRSLAVVIPTISEPVINEIVEAVEDAAITENYTLLLCSTRGDSERECAYISLLTQQTLADGVLYVSPRAAPEDVLRLLRGDAPVVLCNYRLDEADAPSVMIDHVSSMYRATRYLLTLGHRRIALLNLNAPYYHPARMRRQGFEKAFSEAALMPDPTLMIELSQPTYDTDEWRAAIAALFDRADPPTAVVAFNDKVALQVYAESRQRGLRIPDDLSVTGCDDILTAQHVEPPLTSVRIPAYNLGRLAVQILFRLIRDGSAAVPPVTLLDTELMVRKSCAPPRA